ncbi:MAG: flagellar export chaperone FlgN [Oscillospiraceae bacterium]
MLDYNSMISFFEEYIAHYRTILDFENQKVKMIVLNDIDGLNASISKEQALIMQTNSYEKKRLGLIDEENKAKTFRQIIAEAPQDIAPKLRESHEELSKLIFEIKKVNKYAEEIVNTKLSSLNKASDERFTQSYDKGGAKKQFENEKVSLNKGI